MKRHIERLPAVLILALLTIMTAPASAVPPAPDADFPLVVQVTGTGFVDTIRFADHTSNPMKGNWITLGGGTDAELPRVTLKYSGVAQAAYTRNGNQIFIATYKLSGRTLQYPPSKHQTHTPAQTITYTFHGSPVHAGKMVSVRVISATATALRDAASDAFMGDTSAMKAILANTVYSSTETLNKDGGLVSKTIGSLPAGDYALVIVDETTGNPYSLDVYSATAIEVLDYPSTVTAPSSVTRGTDLQVHVQLTGAPSASRRYGAVIIQQSRYSVDLVLTSDGTTEGTGLTGRGALLVEGTEDSFSLAGIGLEGFDKDQLIAKLNEAYDAAEFSAAFTEYTTGTAKTVPVTTNGLNAGKFIVLVGVWEGADHKLVAFHQREVTVSGPPAPGPTPSRPLTPGQVQAMGDAEAATKLAAMSPAAAAGIMSQITAKKAAAIMGKMTTANAAAIVNEMQTSAAAAVMNEAEVGVAVRVLAAADSAKAAAILGEMNVGRVALVLEEAVSAGKIAELSACMNTLGESRAAEVLLETTPEAGARIVEGMAQDDLHEAAKRVEEAVKLRLGEADPAKAEQMLQRIAETLENADTGALVDIFIEIAGLPETPSTVATVLEAMDTAKALDVISTWIDGGSLDELAKVFSHFTYGFLQEAWMGMNAVERSALFSSLSLETVERLPQMGEFQLSGLQVSPATVRPGQAVTVGVAVENVGVEPGSYTLTLRVNRVTEATRKVALQPGQRQTVELTVSRATAGAYRVDVNGLTASFTVQPAPEPASFTLSDLTVAPATVEPGAPVTITVKATNTGGLPGFTPVELRIDGVREDTRAVVLDPGYSATTSFTVTRDTAGAYTVAVGSLMGGFTVTASTPPPPGVPWVAVLAAVVVVTAVGYIIYRQRSAASP